MTTPGDTPDRNILIQRYHSQLYQLALLVAGDRTAAEQLVQNAYATLPQTAYDAEITLVRGLMPRRNTRRFGLQRARWPKTNYAALDTASANTLLDTLARYTPIARYIIGLHYLRGWSVDEITSLIGGD